MFWLGFVLGGFFGATVAVIALAIVAMGKTVEH